MKLPDYLNRPELTDAPLDYEWTRVIANGFVANPEEDHPKLVEAVELIAFRAAYALSGECAAWVAARLQKHIDITDALLRVEAARAAIIDVRYAQLPRPQFPNPTALDPVSEPLITSLRLVSYALDYYRKLFAGAKDNRVRMMAVNSALLAEHVAPKAAGFGKWLTDALPKARQHYPASKKGPDKEPPMAPDFYDPQFKWSAEAVKASQARFLEQLDPAKNPYLRKPEEMRADGFVGNPYPHLR